MHAVLPAWTPSARIAPSAPTAAMSFTLVHPWLVVFVARYGPYDMTNGGEGPAVLRHTRVQVTVPLGAVTGAGTGATWTGSRTKAVTWTGSLWTSLMGEGALLYQTQLQDLFPSDQQALAYLFQPSAKLLHRWLCVCAQDTASLGAAVLQLLTNARFCVCLISPVRDWQACRYQSSNEGMVALWCFGDK